MAPGDQSEALEAAAGGRGTAAKPAILLVDDDPASVGALLECLERESYRVLVAQDGRSALERVTRITPDLILLDIMMPDMDGFEVCRLLKRDAATRDVPVLFLSALSDTSDKLAAFSAGGVDYLTKPFQYEEVLARVRTHLRLRDCERKLTEHNQALETRVAERTEELERALTELGTLKDRLEAENVYLQQEVKSDHRDIVGSSRALASTLEKVRRVAAADTSVLIVGETGTGKELIARAIHEASPRRGRPMIKLNCAAISAGLVESELFGHMRGAFTGAVDKRIGRFELADGGTLFLDEVTELPLETQVKLLRVLQEREFEPVGSSKTQSVDVRIVAATNRRLEDEIAAGRLRADLYYRLSVFPVDVPPLRERREDIAELVQHFSERLARKLGRPARPIAPTALAALRAHDWPGNVRELQNTIERAMIWSTGDELTIDWPLASAGASMPAAAGVTGVPAAATSAAPAAPPESLEAVEREHIIAVLGRTRGVIEGPNGAARLLDMKPSTTRYRIKKLGIRKTDYLA